MPSTTATTSASATPQASGATLAPCGGGAAPAGAWRCTFDDEFSGTTLDRSVWTPQLSSYTGMHSAACRVDSPDTIAVADGTLQLSVRALAAPISCQTPTGTRSTRYVAGGVTTGRSFAQAYGRFEIRAAFPSGAQPGLHEALWLYPQRSTYGAWPASGEIDIAEVRSAAPNTAVPTLHYAGDTADPFRTKWTCGIGDGSAFHNYAVVWTPTAISFEYDGQTCLTDSRWTPTGLAAPAPFDQPFFLLLNQELGSGLNAFDPLVRPLPATTKIDYVRVWQMPGR